MRNKIEIYRDILDVAVLEARNGMRQYLTYRFWERIFFQRRVRRTLTDTYRLLQIVHDLPSYIRESDYDEWDIYFVNERVAVYLKAEDAGKPPFDKLRLLITDLVVALPPELYDQINNLMFLPDAGSTKEK